MTEPGPALAALTRRLAETPADFLREPMVKERGEVVVAAVVADVLRGLGGAALTPDEARRLQPEAANPRARNRLRLILVACWLLGDPALQGVGRASDALGFLTNGLDDLAGALTADRGVTDPDGREELARLCLRALGLRPAGESEAEAADRLQAVSATERQRVVAAARAAEARAREVRAAMQRQAAQEAEMKAMRE